MLCGAVDNWCHLTMYPNTMCSAHLITCTEILTRYSMTELFDSVVDLISCILQGKAKWTRILQQYDCQALHLLQWTLEADLHLPCQQRTKQSEGSKQDFEDLLIRQYCGTQSWAKSATDLMSALCSWICDCRPEDITARSHILCNA